MMTEVDLGQVKPRPVGRQKPSLKGSKKKRLVCIIMHLQGFIDPNMNCPFKLGF